MVSTNSVVLQPSNVKQSASNSKLDLDNLFTIESSDSSKQTTKDARAKEYELKKCIGKSGRAWFNLFQAKEPMPRFTRPYTSLATRK